MNGAMVSPHPPGRNLRELLREANAEVDRVELPREVDRRLRDRLFRNSTGRSWMFAVGAGCVAAALAVLWVAWPERANEPQRIDGYLVSASSADLQANVRQDHTIEISRGSCVLVDSVEGEELAISSPALLRHEPTGVRVVAGTVVVTVQKRRAGPSARVLVSDGVIEVLGTRFTVIQGAERGSVTLQEGEIRFHDLRGGSRAVAPGERLEWPPLPSSPPTPETPPTAALTEREPTKVRRPVKASTSEPISFRDPEDLLQQVDVLRSRGLFAEAARYLKHGLTTDLSPATRERFSYELGSILTWRLNEPAAACAHWREHARRYPAGRYQTEVQQASVQSGCEGTLP